MPILQDIQPFVMARGGGIGGPLAGDPGGTLAGTLQRAARLEALSPIAAQRGQSLTPSGELFGPSDLDRQLGEQARQFNQNDARRQQMLNLIFGETKAFEQGGGFLGTDFFSSILGNTLPGVVGGVSGALGPILGGGGSTTQPGGGGIPGIPGGGSGSLFDQLLAGRGALGGEIMNQLSGFGQSQREAIRRQASNLEGSELAGLEARGLGSSSLAGGARQRAAEFERRGLGELEDQLIGQRVGALQGIGEGLFGDVGDELNRQLTSRGQGLDLVSSLFGSALNVI